MDGSSTVQSVEASRRRRLPAALFVGAPVQSVPLRLELNLNRIPMYDVTPDAIVERQKVRESNARSYPRRIPIAIAEAQGVYVKDTRGNVYVDCLAGAGALALGHNHPAVVGALHAALDSGLALQTLDLSTAVKDRFVDRVFGLLPDPLKSRGRIQFCSPSGADAVEAAMKLVKHATGRRSLLSFQGAYHGMTHGALALMGNLGPKRDVSGLTPDVHFLPFPYAYRCPFGVGGAEGQRMSLQWIASVLGDPEGGVPEPAGLIVEPVQGEGGVIPAPDEWLQALRAMTHRHRVPLILDEVQTGLGRTGAMFAFEHAGVVPDVLVLSKAIGGGLPLAVVIYDESLDQWRPGAHAGTFRGNQLAMAAGLATLDEIERSELVEHADRMGRRLIERLEALRTRYPEIGEVRGRGLMVGMEIVDPRRESERGPSKEGALLGGGAPPGDGALAAAIQREALRRGVILELGGRHGAVVRMLPPLIVRSAEIDFVASVLEQAVKAALSDRCGAGGAV